MDQIKNIKNYYDAFNGDLPSVNGWYVNYDKKHAFKIYSDFDAIDESNKKLIVPAVLDTTDVVNKFSEQINKIFKKTKIITDINGEESIQLDMDDRIVTIVMDQSGSMTWNDKNKFRFTLAKEIINKISLNYPGEIKYNIVQYGAKVVNVCFFGVIDDGTFDSTTIDSLNALYFANDDANFAGIRVVKNEDHYPNSYLDGEVVSSGFVSKIFDDELTNNHTYYYTVYTYDNNYRFSNGVQISVTPRIKNVPRGISTFDSWINRNDQIKKYTDDKTLIGDVFVGSGIIIDDNVVAAWHCDEGDGTHLFDFSRSKVNLEFDNSFIPSSQWLTEQFVPAGESGIWFDGLNTVASYSDNDNKLVMSNNSEFTIMGWIFPFIKSSMVICSRQPASVILNSEINYIFAVGEDNNLMFSNGNSTVISNLNVIGQTWNHVAVTCNLITGDVVFYINGVLGGNGVLANTTTSDSVSMWFDIGSNRNKDNGVFGNYGQFYGEMTEISVHNIIRSLEYIQDNVKYEPITNSNNIYLTGLKGDNGDRLAVLRYVVPDDYDFSGGSIHLIRKDNGIPSWEGDGIAVDVNYIIVPGEHLVTDSDNFFHDSSYYYRVYVRNFIGNYSYPSDSASLRIDIPKSGSEYLPTLTYLSAPQLTNDSVVAVAGNEKVYLKWRNVLPGGMLSDENVSRVRIYYSNINYPTISIEGGSDGQLIFTGLPTEEKFVHRYLINGQPAYYTVVNVDKYGRATNGSFISGVTTPTASASESSFPLSEVVNLHYEIVSENAVNISWDHPIQNPEKINTYFDETVLLYAVITDELGESISQDTPVSIDLTAIIIRESQSENVFDEGGTITFNDSDVYTFTVIKMNDGIIKGILRITDNPSIVSNISKAIFTAKVKSSIYDSSEDRTVFEYVSNPIEITFTNPWEVTLSSRDNQKVYQRCYVPVTSKVSGEKFLNVVNWAFNGVYMKSSSPFIARAKVKYKGQPLDSGSINLVIWDAEADLCSCAGAEEPSKCEVLFTKTQISKIIFPPANTMSLVRGFEDIISGIVTNIPSDISSVDISAGNDSHNHTISGQIAISYVDIPITAPSFPSKVILYVKGTNAGYSSVKSLPILFQSLLNIDINANAPIIDGANIAEQQSTAYVVDPDNPAIVVPIDDNTVVQWAITKIDGEHNRTIYSTDRVPIYNGIFSYSRGGLARNVWFGPMEPGQSMIKETHEISATIVYQNMTSFAKQYIKLYYDPILSPVFGARFLMETEYFYKYACGNVLITDGEDNVKFYISRNPATANTTVSEIFRQCSLEENKPLLELNSGQIIHIVTGDNELEILYGEIYEHIDEYTGNRFLSIGPDGHISQGEAYIPLNDETVTDTTVFYIRANKFCGDSEAQCSYCKSMDRFECDKELDINLKCLDLNDCDSYKGDQAISGTTTLYVNGRPLTLYGGGSLGSGVPPCMLAYREPLSITGIWKKIDGVQVDSFWDELSGKSLITVTSIIDIRVEVSFSDLPVPDGTPVNVIIGNNQGLSILRAEKNIVTTVEQNGHSYADINLYVGYDPVTSVIDTVKISCQYDKTGNTEREKHVSYSITVEKNDIEEEETHKSPSLPSPLPPTLDLIPVYSKTMERYNIANNSWDIVTDMSNKRGDCFVGVVNEFFYVIGGLSNNIHDNASISSANEQYNMNADVWKNSVAMITPRYGGMSITIGSDIYTIGGIEYDTLQQVEKISKALEVFHTNSDTWEILPSMPIMNENSSSQIDYGIAFGTAQHIEIYDGSNLKNYIYILCGCNSVDLQESNVKINSFNNRVLRYCVEDKQWTYSRELTDFGGSFNYELSFYQRISPLSLVHNERIIVFNGAFEENGVYDLPPEVFSINVDIDWDNFNTSNSGYTFGRIPDPKFKSAIAKYDKNPSEGGLQYFIVGGSNTSQKSLDIIERIDVANNPFGYNGISNGLLPLPIAKKGHNLVSGIGINEVVIKNPSVLVSELNPSTGVIINTRYVNTSSTTGGDGTTNDIVGANRAYSHLSEWNTDRQSNLVANNTIEYVECYGNADTNPVTINGWTTGPNNYIHIVVPKSQRHNGTRSNTKYRLAGSLAWLPFLRIQEDYVRIEGLQVHNYTLFGGIGIRISANDSISTDIRLTDVIVYDNSSNGIMVFTGVCTMNNCISVGNGGDGFLISDGGIITGKGYAYNCNAVNNAGNGFSVAAGRTFVVKNCYAGGNTAGDYNAGLTMTTCYASDMSANTHTHFSISEGTYFTNVTAGTEDLHIGDNSALINAGTDLSDDVFWIHPDGNVDIDGDIRGVNWDVGVDENIYKPDNILKEKFSCLYVVGGYTSGMLGKWVVIN